MPKEENSFNSDQSNISGEPQGNQPEGTPADSGDTLESLGISVEDVKSLMKRDTHAQDFIDTLKTERAADKETLSEYQELLKKSLSVQDALDNSDNSDAPTGLNEEDLLSKALDHVRAGLAEEKSAEQQEVNWDSVTKTLTTKYGEKVDEHMKGICKELDMTWDEAVALAKSKPAAALKMFGATANTATSNAPTTSTVNSESFNQDQQDRPVNVMTLRTAKEKVNNFEARLTAKVKELGSQY